jgi:peptidoglycan/LPS O-acetylase OafA/YrhL
MMIFMGHFLHLRDHVSHAVTPFWIRVVSQYWAGVDLFFVISGFVIFLSLSRLTERLTTTGVFRSYVTSRVFRIAPVYFLLILAYFYIPFHNGLMNSALFTSSVPLWVYLVLGQSWWIVFHQRAGAPFVQPTWSLCAEEFLYVLIFLIISFVSKRHILKTMAAVATVSVGLRIFTVLSGGDLVGAFMLPVYRMDGFMLGCIVALLYSRGQLAWVSARVLNWFIALCTVGFVAMTYSDVNLFGPFAITFGYAFYAVFFAAVLTRVVIGGDFSFLARGPLAYLGNVSYFVYLAQFPIAYAMSYVPGNVVLNLAMTLGIVLGAATLSWRWMEKPLIERGRSLNAACESHYRVQA